MSRTRTITLTVGSLAVGALLATGATGLAMADDASSAPAAVSSATQSPGAVNPGPDGVSGLRGGPDGGMRGPGGPGGRHGMDGGPRGEALHGEAVVKAADGTISTVRQIQGAVTAVSATSITVEAEDGYSATFVVNGDTEVRTGLPSRDGTGPDATTDSIADVSVGDVAHVGGTVDGSTATADRVHAMTADEAATMEQLRQQHMEDRGASAGTNADATTQSS